MKVFVKGLIQRLKPILEPIAQMECILARKWVASAHKRLLFVQWSLPPGPEHFDHSIDLFYQWVQSRNPLWLEEGYLAASP